MKTNSKRILLFTLVIAVLTAALLALLLYNGVILLNNPSIEDFPVRGVDVSSYQGEINWRTLSAQGISFAFIKATEGSNHVDRNFQINYQLATETDLRIGAYHFFSYDSPGETQADNFISAVHPIENMLPPVVDVEFYGDKEENLPDRERTQIELTVLLERLETHYGMKPIIYATSKSFELYIAGNFNSYDIWIRNVFIEPSLPDDREWSFWQYTDHGKLEGYNGDERFIDMNVFNGTEEEFAGYWN